MPRGISAGAVSATPDLAVDSIQWLVMAPCRSWCALSHRTSIALGRPLSRPDPGADHMRIGAAVDKGEAPRNLLEIVRFPHVEDQCITAAAHHGRLHDQPARLVSADGEVSHPWIRDRHRQSLVQLGGERLQHRAVRVQHVAEAYRDEAVTLVQASSEC